MKDTGKDKVKQICDILRKETLEPARDQADEIVRQARAKAEEIVKQAQMQAELVKQQAAEEISREKTILCSSLNQACKQAIDSLKETIEKRFFHAGLLEMVRGSLQQADVMTALIKAVIGAIDREGTGADLEVAISKAVSKQDINAALGGHILQKLRDHSVSLGDMQGGVEVKIADSHMIIDVTDVAVKELIAQYIRKDFRHLLFEEA